MFICVVTIALPSVTDRFAFEVVKLKICKQYQNSRRIIIESCENVSPGRFRLFPVGLILVANAEMNCRDFALASVAKKY